MADTATEYDALIDGEEFVEVQDGEFPPSFFFADKGESQFVGVYKDTETKTIKGKERTIHHFVIEKVEGDVEWSGEAGEVHTVWGTAILDSRLKPVDPDSRCLVVKTGKKLSSQSGNQPWEFKVLVARSALGR